MVWLALLSAGVVAIALGGLLIRLGLSGGFVDQPDDDLKTHTGTPVPLGGVAILVGAVVGLFVAEAFDPWLLASSSLLLVIGLVDDRRGLPPLFRLGSTVVAGVILALGSTQVSGFAGLAATTLLVVVTVNAVNLLDGLDSLAGSVTAAAFVGLSILASDPVLLIPAAALLGFLYWNTPPARLYLGDNGAYVVGLLLSWAVIESGSTWSGWMVAAALIGVPFLDLGATVLRRVRSGAALFEGDRDHTYDRLNATSVTVSGVAAVFFLGQVLWMTIVLVAVALLGEVFAAVLALALAVAVVVALSASPPAALAD